VEDPRTVTISVVLGMMVSLWGVYCLDRILWVSFASTPVVSRIVVISLADFVLWWLGALIISTLLMFFVWAWTATCAYVVDVRVRRS
jgi:hypothetical protein